MIDAGGKTVFRKINSIEYILTSVARTADGDCVVLAGRRSADETAQIIHDRVGLYVNERR